MVTDTFCCLQLFLLLYVNSFVLLSFSSTIFSLSTSFLFSIPLYFTLKINCDFTISIQLLSLFVNVFKKFFAFVYSYYNFLFVHSLNTFNPLPFPNTLLFLHWQVFFLAVLPVSAFTFCLTVNSEVPYAAEMIPLRRYGKE